MVWHLSLSALPEHSSTWTVSVFSKSHSPDRHCWRTNIRQGPNGCRPTSCPKCVVTYLVRRCIYSYMQTDAKHRPEGALGGDVTGMRAANSGSITDRLTREHRMTLDEARLILNLKKEEPAERMLQVRFWSLHAAHFSLRSQVLIARSCQHYEYLFKANSPPEAPAKPAPGKKATQLYHSHYLQSKVVRARERIEAETKSLAEAEGAPSAEAGARPSSKSTTTPPPPPPTQDGGPSPSP